MAGAGSQLSTAVALPVTLGPVEVYSCTVVLGGQVITGGVVSAIVIFCVQLLVCPAQSVAVQVRVMILGQIPVTASLWLILGLGSQLSIAVALPVALGSVESLQATVVSAGQVMLGAVESTTLMVWAQLVVLPQLTVAVQVRMMTFVLGQLPGTAL